MTIEPLGGTSRQIMATAKRLGFTFTAQEVADLREVSAYVARVLDDNGPVPPNSDKDEKLRKAAQALHAKFEKRLKAGGAS